MTPIAMALRARFLTIAARCGYAIGALLTSGSGTLDAC